MLFKCSNYSVCNFWPKLYLKQLPVLKDHAECIPCHQKAGGDWLSERQSELNISYLLCTNGFEYLMHLNIFSDDFTDSPSFCYTNLMLTQWLTSEHRASDQKLNQWSAILVYLNETNTGWRKCVTGGLLRVIQASVI